MLSHSTGGGRNVDSGQMRNDVHRRIQAFRCGKNPILCLHGGTHGITFLRLGINLFFVQRRRRDARRWQAGSNFCFFKRLTLYRELACPLENGSKAQSNKSFKPVNPAMHSESAHIKTLFNCMHLF